MSYGLENLVVSGRTDGRKARRRQRLNYMDSLCESRKDKVSPTELSSTTARQHDTTMSFAFC